MSARANQPQACPWVLDLAPYKQGQSLLAGVANPIKLSSNESSLGPSPRAIEAYLATRTRLFRYPDGGQASLRQAIASVFGLEAERLVCGNGSDELIQLVIRAFVRPGDEVLISEHSFIMARIHATAQGARVIVIPESQLLPDVDAILASVTSRTRMVVLASPNNPCGRYLPRGELVRLHAKLPSDVLLLLDSAYADYVTASDFESGAALVQQAPNVVMTRTFSKLYGLSALRIGWLYAQENILDPVQRVRTPFNTNAPALAAAEAAVRDVEYADFVRTHNARELKRLHTAISAMGIDVVPSVANFYLLRFEDGNRTAVSASAFLGSRGIIPRTVHAGGPSNSLRITVGKDDENEAVIQALREYTSV